MEVRDYSLCSCPKPEDWWGRNGWHFTRHANGTLVAMERCPRYVEAMPGNVRVDPRDRTRLLRGPSQNRAEIAGGRR